MARPRHEHPTPAELQVLRVLWDRGPCTVREVMDVLGRRRAYTSVMSLMNVMFEKGLLAREPKGRAFLSRARAKREKTLSGMVGDLLNRAFDGSAGAMVAHLMAQARLSDDELNEIRKAIAVRRRKGGEK